MFVKLTIGLLMIDGNRSYYKYLLPDMMMNRRQTASRFWQHKRGHESTLADDYKLIMFRVIVCALDKNLVSQLITLIDESECVNLYRQATAWSGSRTMIQQQWLYD